MVVYQSVIEIGSNWNERVRNENKLIISIIRIRIRMSYTAINVLQVAKINLIDHCH